LVVIERLSAVTLLTADMARAVSFYERLGFELLYGGGSAPFTSFRVGRGFLNLQVDPSWSPKGAIWGRVIFWVDDVDGVFALAQANGFETMTSPADADWGERYFHLRDPDGHELSFAHPLAPPD
jgi:catechol 2,3-dioxygenase-like lactoylglutathione lyase family enzyme